MGEKGDGEKKEKGGGGGGGEGGEKGDGTTPVELKLDMHCQGCALKVRKLVKNLQGVEGASVDTGNNRLKVYGKVDPWELKELLEAKTKKKVEFISPKDPPKKPKEADKKKDGGGGKDKEETKKEESNSKPPAVTTVVLKIRLHCDGCISRIKRNICKIRGVQDVTVDPAKDQVSVKGTMDAKTLPEILKGKLKRSVEIIAPKKDESGEKKGNGEKNEKGGGGGDKKDKEGGGGGEKDKEGGTKKEKFGGKKDKEGSGGGEKDKEGGAKKEKVGGKKDKEGGGGGEKDKEGGGGGEKDKEGGAKKEKVGGKKDKQGSGGCEKDKEGGGGGEKDKEGGAKKEKVGVKRDNEGGGGGEKDKDGGAKKEKEGGKKDAAAATSSVPEANRMDYYYSPYGGFAPASAPYGEYGYRIEMVHAPQMFSDENPNACSVM